MLNKQFKALWNLISKIYHIYIMPMLTKKILPVFSASKLKKRFSWLTNHPLERAIDFLSSWWHAILIFIACIMFIYYPLGGAFINNIDRNTDYEIILSKPEQSATVTTMSYLINREVNDKIWTPNLPFFFPSYFLDNMPSFQLGMFEALSNMSIAFGKKLDKKTEPGVRRNLQEAAELLKYPGTVWMFSPENKLIPAPSANNQYRRARKRLIKYNDGLSNGYEVFYKTPSDLIFFLTKTRRDLTSSLNIINEQIREHSSDVFNTKSDNIFYYHQGKIYAYYLLYKALGIDYKEIILLSNQYQNWTLLLSAMERGLKLNPYIVRNGELNSIFAPNHLSYLSYYILNSQNLLMKISKNLEYKNPIKEHR